MKKVKQSELHIDGLTLKQAKQLFKGIEKLYPSNAKLRGSIKIEYCKNCKRDKDES